MKIFHLILLLLIMHLILVSCDDSAAEVGMGIKSINFDKSSEIIDSNQHELYFSWEKTKDPWEVVYCSEIIANDTTVYFINQHSYHDDTIKTNWFHATKSEDLFYVKVLENSFVVNRKIVIEMSGPLLSGFISIVQTGQN